jgi:hypothetical protein
MKLLGILLLIGSLTLGTLAAATAYLVPLELPDEEIEGLTLAADAGGVVRKRGGDGRLFKKGTHLSPPVITSLRWSGIDYVLVQEFAFARWPGKWVFLGAAIGLLVSAGLLRFAGRRRSSGPRAAGEVELPEKALRAIGATVADLRREVAALPDERTRQALILERLGQLQRTHMPAFVEARPLLVARLGLGGYAELMDRYAAAERQINRAWSAAADGVLAESVRCLDQASQLLSETARHALTTEGPMGR